MKKYEIEISPSAHEDILNCARFLKNVSLEVAIQLVDDIYGYIESFKSFPERNALFNMPNGTNKEMRKGIVNNRFIVIYEVEKEIIVHRVIDSRKGFDHLII